MTGLIKVALVVFVIAVIVGIVAGIVVGVMREGRLGNAAAPSAAGARQEERRGRDFGRGKDPAACMDHALIELRSGSGFPAEERARLFLRGCLATANPNRAFCEGVPRSHETAASEWTINECRQRDAADITRCSRVMREVVEHCSR